MASLPRFARSMDWPEMDVSYRLNYGFDRVRLFQPVPTGRPIRCRFVVRDATEKTDNGLLAAVTATLEMQAGPEPVAVLMAEWLFYFKFNT